MTIGDENLGEAIDTFVIRYSDNDIQTSLALMAEDDPRRLTSVLLKGAFCFDPQVATLYYHWRDEVLEGVLSEVFERVEYDGSLADCKPTPEHWKVIHTEIEFTLLDRLNDAEHLRVMEEWLLGDPSAQGMALRSSLAFLKGEKERTIEQYEEALKLLRKETGRRNVMIPGIPVLFFALALIQQRQTKYLIDRLFTDAIYLEKQHDDLHFSSVLRILADFARVDSGTIELTQSPWLTHELMRVDPWADLFQGLVIFWLGGRPGDKQIRRLFRHADNALSTGLYWYAGKVTALLEMLGIDAGEIDYLSPIGSESELAELYQVKSNWEENLAALNLITRHYGVRGDTASEGQLGADHRMVWWVGGESHFASLEPREQKRSKKGVWSKGRKVAIRRLHEELDSFSYLTSADLKICAAIDVRQAYKYGYYIESTYQLMGEQALCAAIGHPHLYRADMDGRDRQTVTLKEVSPRIEVVEDKKEATIKIELFPYPESIFDLAHDFFCHWAERHLLQMTKFSDSQLEIAQILTQKGLVAPLSAKEQILSSLTSMAPLVMIHSDIGGGSAGDAEEIAADTTPHFHLHPITTAGELRVEMGFQLSLHYKPLGEKGPTFHPGEGRAALFGEIEGQSRKTRRDLKKEVEQATHLIDQLPLLAGEDPWKWTLDDPEQALEVLLILQEMGDEIVVAWPEGKKVTLSHEITGGQMQIRMRKQRDWFGLNGELQIDEGQVIEMEKLLSLLQQAPGRFLRLDDGRILTLSRQLRQQLDTLHAIRDKGKIHPLATAVVEEVTEGMVVTGGKPWQEQLARLREAESLQPELPDTLQAELRDYQMDGFCWLTRLAHWGAGACLADDMGLGKTLQALALIVQRAPGGPALVVAPTSVCSNWIEEAQRFAPTLRPQRFGDEERQQMLDSAGPYDLVICSYGLLQSEIERIKEREWQTIVADEAQAFKNSNTKRSKAMMSLQGACRIITTGTPIENHLGELWNLFRFINPGLLGSQERFNERFANPIELHQDEQAKHRLKSLIRPFILRRLKREVLTELPPRTEITHYVEFNNEESSFYEALRRRAMARIAELPEHPGQQRFKVLTEITRLRQAACHPRLVAENSPVGSAKLRAFVEILEELRENHHHALVFSQFVGHLSLIREYLDQQGIDYQYLDGSTSVKKRKEAVDAFQRGEGELFLISLKAGGSGLNLTAADYVIHMDPWWNPAVEDQASDRAHRMGQTRPVTIYRLVVKGTIEEKIVALHAHKRNLADGLLEGTDANVRLSVGDLVDLISEA
ncbi:MAG: DEAD/DEAH box helicase [Sedimenticola sp.]